MDSSPFATASRSLQNGIPAVRASCDSRADADTRIAALAVGESLTPQLEHLPISLVARLDADGVFPERGYTRPGHAVADLRDCVRRR